MGQNKIREGSTVTWKWSSGTGEGKVVDIHRERVERTLKGSDIVRDGSYDDPAYLIEQEDGALVLKLRSELEEG